MSNMLLVSALLSDVATLSGSAVAAGLPLENLQRAAIGAPARFLTPDGCYVVADMGAALPVDFLGLLGHNASFEGTVRIRAATLEANLESAPDYDSGDLRLRANVVDPTYDDSGSLPTNHFMLHLPAAVTYQYWRFDMLDEDMEYLDVGRLYIGKAFEPETNMSYGLQEGFIDPSTSARTASGRVVPNKRPVYRYADFELSFASEDEMFGVAFDLDRLCGTTRDVLFVQDYANKNLLQKRTIYGNMRSLSPVINTSFRNFGKRYRVEEIIA